MRRKIMGMAGCAVLLALAGPASAAERNFGLTSFEKIVLDGDFAVEVSSKAPIGARASGPQNALDRVELRSAGGTLTISDRQFGSNRQRGASAGPVVIRVNAAIVRSIAVAGAGSLTIDQLRGAKVDVSLRGPGSISVGKVSADRLTLWSTGNGTVKLAGAAKLAETVVSGAGIIDAAALAVTDLNVSGEGAADQRYQASRTAQITTRGIGRVVVDGKAKCTTRNMGTGSVTCGVVAVR
jgi:Putative auto-transporter adhesin, head GIN domain